MAGNIIDSSDKKPEQQPTAERGGTDLEHRQEHSLIGLVIGEGRDLFGGAKTANEAKERAAQNDQVGHIATDVVASLPYTHMLIAGLVRGSMLIDPNASIGINIGSFVLNDVGGMALNGASRFTLAGTRLGSTIEKTFSSEITNEAANHLVSGAVFSAVRAGFDKQTWTDANGSFAPVDGVMKFTESTAVGALINVPAAMIGLRAAKPLTTEVLNSSAVGRMALGTIAGATSGGVYNFTDSLVHSGSLKEAGTQFIVGSSIGALTGGIATHLTERAGTALANKRERDYQRNLEERKAEAAEYGPSIPGYVGGKDSRRDIDAVLYIKQHESLFRDRADMAKIYERWDEVSSHAAELQPDAVLEHIRLADELQLQGWHRTNLQEGSKFVGVLKAASPGSDRDNLHRYWNDLTEKQQNLPQDELVTLTNAFHDLEHSTNSTEFSNANMEHSQYMRFATDGFINRLYNNPSSLKTMLDAVPGLKEHIIEDKYPLRSVKEMIANEIGRGNVADAQSIIKLDLLDKEVIAGITAQALKDGHVQSLLRLLLASGESLEAASKRTFGVDDLSEQNARKAMEFILANDKELKKTEAPTETPTARQHNDEIIDDDFQPGNWDNQDFYRHKIDQGMERFGAAKMMRYMFDARRTTHDLLLGFGDILQMQERSGLDPERFYNNILVQVKRDYSANEDGNSVARLNTIAMSYLPSLAETREAIAQYPNLKALQDSLAKYPDEASIYASWKSLEKYSKLQTIIERSALVESIEKLRADGRGDLAKWAEVLAFDPKSAVSAEAINHFVFEPNRFLERDDSHSSYRTHDAKKPSNYTDIPHLDLTAEQLRDSLVNGTLDRLQVFTPMSAEYVVGGPTLAKELEKALGSKANNVEGKAQRVGRLYKETRELLASENITPQDVINGAQLTPRVASALEALIYKKGLGISEPTDRYKLTASIHRKSDPLSAIAGDETECCMTFGSGKNNIYMFNPNDAIFTIRLHRPDGTSGIIAQSVLTKDMDVKSLVPKLVREMEAGKEDSVHTLVSDSVLEKQKSFIAGDNIEVRGNHRNKIPAIEAVYKDFFARYVQAHGEQENLNSDKMLVGLGYSAGLNDLPTEANTFVPQAPPAYSDKQGDRVAALHFSDKPQVGIRLTKLESEAVADRVATTHAPGVTPLTFESTIPVSYMESKIFENSPSLRVGIHNLENALIAKDINNAAKGRPNLSLKYADENGKMKGYMLAYEGRTVINDFETPSIFISDFSTLRDATGKSNFANQAVGGKLLLAFGEAYKQNYLDKGNYVPIEANAKEDTSYKLLRRNLDKLGRITGVNFKLVEREVHNDDGTIVHDILLVPQPRAANPSLQAVAS